MRGRGRMRAARCMTPGRRDTDIHRHTHANTTTCWREPQTVWLACRVGGRKKNENASCCAKLRHEEASAQCEGTRHGEACRGRRAFLLPAYLLPLADTPLASPKAGPSVCVQVDPESISVSPNLAHNIKNLACVETGKVVTRPQHTQLAQNTVAHTQH